MNVEREFCNCGNRLLKLSTQAHYARIARGYYCEKCDALLDVRKEYLIPADLLIRLDPELQRVSKIEAYLSILKTRDTLKPNSHEALIIISANCREPGIHDNKRLDRVALTEELKKEIL